MAWIGSVVVSASWTAVSSAVQGGDLVRTQDKVTQDKVVDLLRCGI